MKIENKLSQSDFADLADVFRDESVDLVELLPTIDFGFVKVLPLVVSRSDNGYTISTRMFFADPIGNTVCVNIGIEEFGIWKRSKKIELDLRKPLTSSEELGKDITYGLLLVDKVVNYACMIRDEDRYDCYVVDSKLISKQIEKKTREKEREARHEKLEPFAIIHTNAGYDLGIQSKDLIQIFWEYDKYDLYGEKKAYCVLPRSFATTLLKCDKSVLVPEEQFSKAGKKVLDELVKRKYLRTRQIAGKTYYFDLNSQTRTYLIKTLNISQTHAH
jgi:hypothetical protein